MADNASIAFPGNRYSVPPGLSGVELELRHWLGTATVEVLSLASGLPVTHRLTPASAGTLVRTPERRVGEGRALGVHHRSTL